MSRFFLTLCCIAFAVSFTSAQNLQNNPGSNHGNKFEQLGPMLPTPNEYRTASGAPGNKYWQQQVDYDIKCELDEKKLMLTGEENITYINNSPDELSYLWLQLDENQHSTVNNAGYENGSSLPRQMTDAMLDASDEKKKDNGYGFNLLSVKDASGKNLKYVVNKTMMRIDLDKPIKPGKKFSFNIKWNYKIVDRMDFMRFSDARGGYEYFEEDGNYLFTMAQWYPRLCVYNDAMGWQNHQFTGRGEFALCFGNFKVEMTVPADHIVGATGKCVNYKQVLTPTEYSRMKKAQTSSEPVDITTLEESNEKIKTKSSAKKTWIFQADNVRDFAWTASRRFAWDAMAVKVGDNNVMCLSYYCKEAYPIYHKFSTKAVAHTIKTYSDFSVPYPYPVAQSVEAANGMEYPMICFNPGRALPDGSYTEGSKNSALLVIIHEVGHNFFPMIVNSDERQSTWMDEGLNSYLQYLTQELWDNTYPSDEGPAYTITDYMKLDKDQLEPIMTNSENIVRFGPNAYSKVATGLNILRETIVGRELFDNAFREYAKRWAFKHPTPADFFRTIEDATGEDLDWFWRGWFYSTDACDISIDTIKHAVPDINAEPARKEDFVMKTPLAKPQVNEYDDISKIRNREDKNIKFVVDQDTSLQDFYYKYDRGLVEYDTTKYDRVISPTTEKLGEEGKKYEQKHVYEITFSNKGGLVMPIILKWEYADGTSEIQRIPAQVWRKNEAKLTKAFLKDKEVTSVTLDPFRETADIDESNNVWGKEMPASKFDLFKQKNGVKRDPGPNPMQKAMNKGGV